MYVGPQGQPVVWDYEDLRELAIRRNNPHMQTAFAAPPATINRDQEAHDAQMLDQLPDAFPPGYLGWPFPPEVD